MRRRMVGLIAALVLATGGTAVLVAYVGAARERAESGGSLVRVLVAKEAITAGTPAAALSSKVKVVMVPRTVKAKGAIDELADLGKRVATIRLVAGEQLVASRFGVADTVAADGISPELLRVTLALEPERALGGQIRVRDHVAVIGSFIGEGSDPDVTHLVLHRVVVAGVQWEDAATASAARPPAGDSDKAAQAPTGKLLVTLALDAAAIEKVVFVAEHGTIWLAAQPAAVPVSTPPAVTRSEVVR